MTEPPKTATEAVAQADDRERAIVSRYAVRIRDATVSATVDLCVELTRLHPWFHGQADLIAQMERIRGD